MPLVSRHNSMFASVVISIVFLLTGVGTALLGSALPAMLAEWHLSDRSGGWLLLSAFAGSTLGAAAVHRPHRLVPAAGMLLSAVGTSIAAIAGGHLPHLGFLLYGFGLGITMTAISLLQSEAVGPAGNHNEMNRLNLLWAVGACCAPPLALHSLHRVSVDSLLRITSLVLLFSGLALAASATNSPEVSDRAQTAPLPRDLDPLVPVRLCLFAGAAVGLESAIGSWLTTYTQRRVHASGFALSATALFWFGLLLSRLAHSVHAGRRLQSRRGILLHVGSVALAAVLLIAVPHGTALLPAAFFAGWGLGPLYPLALSLALPRYRSGPIFVTAGVGAALLPWLTGALSTTTHSLRLGMLAPCFTILLLVGAGLWMWSDLPDRVRV